MRIFSAGSPSSIPAASRTIVAMGAKVALSVERWLRPIKAAPSTSSPAMNSSASRDFPIPDSPTTVTSSGRSLALTRAKPSRRIVSSFARPTKGMVRRTDRVLSD